MAETEAELVQICSGTTVLKHCAMLGRSAIDLGGYKWPHSFSLRPGFAIGGTARMLWHVLSPDSAPLKRTGLGCPSAISTTPLVSEEIAFLRRLLGS